MFEEFDADSNRRLTRGEVTSLLARQGLDSSDTHIDVIFERYDTNNSGDIDRKEFEEFARDLHGEGADDEPPNGEVYFSNNSIAARLRAAKQFVGSNALD